MAHSFLFLQGTASPFFARLAAAVHARGHRAARVNFCGGDRLYAGSGASLEYRGTTADLTPWYADCLDPHVYSDVVMFGDCRAVHQPVHDLSEARGLRVHVFEEGYVRPDWLTLERHGVNGRSTLPRDPDWYVERHKADPVGTVARATGYNLRERAWHDIRYRLATAAYAHQYPYYRSHRPRNGCVEYMGLANRFAYQPVHRRHAERVTAELLGQHTRYFLFPLQLGSDAQIVVHSPFADIRQAIDCVIDSFARHAPGDTVLLIKNHPLDTGLIDYRRYAYAAAKKRDVRARLRFIDAGHLPTLLQNAQGVVVVNSTVGLSALHHGCPLVALGRAIYALDRLTWQAGLDSFWSNAVTPDMDVYWAFLDYLIKRTQVNGDFYTKSGIALAVDGAIRRLEEADHG